MRKLTLLAGIGVGYVLGTRAGRERYEQLKSQAQRIVRDPRVQEKAQHAADVVKEQAPVVKDKVSDAASSAASSAASKVRSSSDSDSDLGTSSTTAEPVTTPAAAWPADSTTDTGFGTTPSTTHP